MTDFRTGKRKYEDAPLILDRMEYAVKLMHAPAVWHMTEATHYDLAFLLSRYDDVKRNPSLSDKPLVTTVFGLPIVADETLGERIIELVNEGETERATLVLSDFEWMD